MTLQQPGSTITKTVANVLLLLTLACAPALAADDAYQLLRGDPQGYAEVTLGKPLAFPADHQPTQTIALSGGT